MFESDEDLVIDFNDDEKHVQSVKEPVPSTSSHNYQISKASDSELHSDTENELNDCNPTDNQFGLVSDFSDGSDSTNGHLCAICLGHIRGKVGSPDAVGCEHFFCLLCILEWAKNNPTCPQDRRPFERILVKKYVGGKVISEINTIKDILKDVAPVIDALTFCEVCGSSDREDCLLLCDGCDLGYHLDCLSPPLSEVPIEEWFCPLCIAAEVPLIVGLGNNVETRTDAPEEPPSPKKIVIKVHTRTRMIPRTRASERVLQRISQTRKKKRKQRKRKKPAASPASGSDLDDDGDGGRVKKRRGGFTLQIKRAKPFGSINDDDVDAAFNHDEYADRLLSSNFSMNLKEKKKMAWEKLNKHSPIPSASYAGRVIHPKVNDCSVSQASTDILTNILENQFVLLSNTKDILLTEGRQLSAKEGKKKMDFDVDRENYLMSKPLPSQRKTTENDPPSGGDRALEERECRAYSPRRQSPRSDHRGYKSHGYSSSRSESFKSKGGYRSSRNKYDYDKDYNSRRGDLGKRRRERSRSRSRSRSRERDRERNRRNYRVRDSKSSPHGSRYRRSRSKERDRMHYKSRHHSRTPERHGPDKKPNPKCSKLINRLFGTCPQTDTPETKTSESLSVHSMQIPPQIKQTESAKIFEEKNKFSDFKPSSEEPESGFHSSSIPSPALPTDVNLEPSSNDIDYSSSSKREKCFSPNNPANDHSKTIPSIHVTPNTCDSDVNFVVETRKKKLRQLFGDDNNEFNPPLSTDAKSQNIDTRNYLGKGDGSNKMKQSSSKGLFDYKPTPIVCKDVNLNNDNFIASSSFSSKSYPHVEFPSSPISLPSSTSPPSPSPSPPPISPPTSPPSPLPLSPLTSPPSPPLSSPTSPPSSSPSPPPVTPPTPPPVSPLTPPLVSLPTPPPVSLPTPPPVSLPTPPPVYLPTPPILPTELSQGGLVTQKSLTIGDKVKLSPYHNQTLDSEADLKDITVLSQTSQNFILSNLFGTKSFLDNEEEPKASTYKQASIAEKRQAVKPVLCHDTTEKKALLGDKRSKSSSNDGCQNRHSSRPELNNKIGDKETSLESKSTGKYDSVTNGDNRHLAKSVSDHKMSGRVAKKMSTTKIKDESGNTNEKCIKKKSYEAFLSTKECTSDYKDAASNNGEKYSLGIKLELIKSKGDGKDVISIADKRDSPQDNSKRKSQTKKEIFSNLFGDVSDHELLDQSYDKVFSKEILKEKASSLSVPNTKVQGKDHRESPINLQNEEKKGPHILKGDLMPKTLEKESKQNSGRSQLHKTKANEGSQVNGTKETTALLKAKANRIILETKVVEEAKRFLNPHYQEKGFSKEIYKEIISKCVNKVLEVECGITIEPKKIQKLVEGYVHMYHHRNKKSGKSSTESGSGKS